MRLGDASAARPPSGRRFFDSLDLTTLPMSYASPASVCPDTTNLEKLVQTIAYGLPALGKEGLIAANTKEGSLRGDALSQKNDTARSFCFSHLSTSFTASLGKSGTWAQCPDQRLGAVAF